MKEREEENLRERLLLEAAGRGEREAFARLLEGCQSRFLALLLRMGIERSEAEHLLLEAFWKVWKGAPRFRGECLASTWITRIVLNTALKALAQKNRLEGRALGGAMGGPLPRTRGDSGEKGEDPPGAGGPGYSPSPGKGRSDTETLRGALLQ